MTVAAIALSTEAGVLVAHHRVTAQPLLNKVRTITDGGTQSPTITIPTGGSEFLLTSLAATHIRVLAVASSGICFCSKQDY
ncbi:hypothetical protein AVEN_65433-1 [Araneus ventricosus]|uniref:Uncharacterized protein n=1 Tax=Araneus ventricosus TaxID=182803 RepID=A0A4Y2VRT3_ARAVE|nr:hypothetical protein AVEN_246711-1 [Araneus ventricosus]GBO26521.1 hypothetical protein AVEN_65433-1 [Araneus ventricosus]